MSRKIFELFALTAGLFISAHASENVNTPENRQFLKQQETLSQQLREKPDTQLQAWAEQQVRANPLQHSDNQFLDELVRKQQAAQKDKPQQGAVYFVSFSIPEEGLKRMLGETRHYGIRPVRWPHVSARFIPMREPVCMSMPRIPASQKHQEK